MKPAAIGSSNGAYFDISFLKTRDGRKWIERKEKTDSDRDENYGEGVRYDVLDGRVFVHKLKHEKGFRYSINIATRKAYYTVRLVSASSSDPTVASILASIRLKQQAVIKEATAPPPTTVTTMKADSLKSSDIVEEALKRKQTTQIMVGVGSKDDPPLGGKNRLYSRAAVFIFKPYPRYTDEARNNSVSGNVILRVLLKANGDIGRITVIKGLPFGLTQQAVRAAAAIKFLPAEIMGMPTDTEVTLDYGFAMGMF